LDQSCQGARKRRESLKWGQKIVYFDDGNCHAWRWDIEWRGRKQKSKREYPNLKIVINKNIEILVTVFVEWCETGRSIENSILLTEFLIMRAFNGDDKAEKFSKSCRQCEEWAIQSLQERRVVTALWREAVMNNHRLRVKRYPSEAADGIYGIQKVKG
jgi:hypothetical protein